MIDGTAMGVVETLLLFERPSLDVEAAQPCGHCSESVLKAASTTSNLIPSAAFAISSIEEAHVSVFVHQHEI